MVKIAVYTISKNEEQFVDRWAKSAEGADYLLIADTGSTDNTVGKARAAGVNVQSITVSPFRFDDARNASLALLPPDIDFCIPLDVDEILVPGWRKIVEDAIAANPRANQFRYNYIHGWKADGSPGLTFYIGKLHARHGFRWRHACHEFVYGINTVRADIPHVLIEHHPDLTKSRGHYLPLLKMAAEEDPYDARMCHYYGRELMNKGQHDEAIKEFDRHITMPSSTWAPERAASLRFKARCLWTKGQYETALESFIQATVECPQVREPWVELAQAYRSLKQWPEMEAACRTALSLHDKSIYFNDANSWSDWPERMLNEAVEKQKEEKARLEERRNRPSRYKIAVYAIAKDEAKTVTRWLRSASAADHILLVDTGSSDDTVRLAREGGVRVETLPIEPWRFDTARNIALNLLPGDIDYCVALDLDEMLTEGWRDLVEEAIDANPGANVFGFNYVMDWTSHEEPKSVFLKNRVHARQGFRWKGAVYDELQSDDMRLAVVEKTLIEQRRNTTRSRGYYIDLLKQQVAEDPRNVRFLHVLGCELMHQGQQREAIGWFERHAESESAPGIERAASLRYKARCHWVFKEYDAAAADLRRSTELSPDTRETWVELAQYYRVFKMWPECRHACEQALAITRKPSSQFNMSSAWTDWPERMLKEATSNEASTSSAASAPIPSPAPVAAPSGKKPRIAVYAIAKDEEKHVQRWIASAQGADHILLADTGSSDATMALARDGGAHVESIEINPWRFDHARNAALKLIPEDIDYCIWLDLDEVLVEGWREMAEAAISAHPDKNLFNFNYVFDWNGDGTPRTVFFRAKLHARDGFFWQGAVHEDIRSNDDRKVSVEKTLVEQHADRSKPRSQYIELMKIRLEEEPENMRLLHRMGVELMSNGQEREAIPYLERYGNCEGAWAMERASAFRYIARCQWQFKEYPQARAALLRATEISPDTREPWVELAQDYRVHGMWAECQYACERALAITTKPNSYLNTASAWSDWPERMLKEAIQKQAEARTAAAPKPDGAKTKIAVYTIAKNEAKHVEKWATSAKDADYLIIADTGSDDDTVEIARRLGITVKSIDVTPWRFDVARNISLDMVPDDADFCICMDMDEVLVPGWRPILEEAIERNPEATRFKYNFVHSWKADGKPDSIMQKEKIHSRSFRWTNAVHEVLVSDNDRAAFIDVPWLIEHHQDLSKSRSSYLPLMKMAAEENPEDDRMAHYYARELMIHQHYDEALIQFDRHLGLTSARWAPERAASLRFKARCYWARKEFGLARQALLEAVKTSPDTREPWVELAQDYRVHRMWAECQHACEQALAIKVKPGFYLDMPSAWSDWPEKMLREAIEEQRKLATPKAPQPENPAAEQPEPAEERHEARQPDSAANQNERASAKLNRRQRRKAKALAR